MLTISFLGFSDFLKQGLIHGDNTLVFVYGKMSLISFACCCVLVITSRMPYVPHSSLNGINSVIWSKLCMITIRLQGALNWYVCFINPENTSGINRKSAGPTVHLDFDMFTCLSFEYSFPIHSPTP